MPDPTPPNPPAEVLIEALEVLVYERGMDPTDRDPATHAWLPLVDVVDAIRRWAVDLDAAPAVYALPAEPAVTWTCPVPGHTDVERDSDETRCLARGCLRSSTDPPGGRRSCECELYDCTGGCCGPGQCSCSTGPATAPPVGTEAQR